jgi:hypothetical protein
MDAAEYCRRRADFFAACANQMTDLKDRAALQNLAAYWARMAEQAERNESDQRPSDA